RKLRIDTRSVAVGVVDDSGCANKIQLVQCSGSRANVGRRKHTHDLLRERVYAGRGNLVALEGSIGVECGRYFCPAVTDTIENCRVGNVIRGCGGGREISHALVAPWNRAPAGHPPSNTRTFVVEKEEQTILEDRAADVRPKLVLDVLRLVDPRAIIEEVIGVEDSIAKELVCGSVVSVCAALGGDADKRAGASPVLGRVRICAEPELLYRVNRGADDLSCELLHVFGDGIVIYAVKDEVVLERANAVDVCAAGTAVGGSSALFGVSIGLHAGHEAYEVVPVSGAEGQVGDETIFDNSTGCRFLCSQDWRVSGNVCCFA